MLKKREGFTLIELLIVIVIIGILAAIAIPKFGKTREKAYFKAMMSDLRNLQSAQEVYYSTPVNNYTYASTTSALGDYSVSSGVTVTLSNTGRTGWAATATHAALVSASQGCGIYVGSAAAPTVAGMTVSASNAVQCTGE